MATTSQTFTGDGSATAFTIAFNYIDTTDVKASINDVATTAFSVSGNTVTFNSAPAANSTVKIFRDTNNETIQASFQSGSALRAVDFNDNFTQILFVSQETTTTADSAVTTANSAVTTANSAVTTANSAVTTANQSISDASSAVTTSNSAVTTANNAVTTANSAVTTANTASTNASAAVTTANSAETKADNAVSTANTASTNASNAVSTANTANTTANSAVSTANTASTNASNAVTTANNAQTAVNNAAIFVIVNNVAAIPGSPSDQDRIEITDSSNVQSSSVVTGLPVGFVGDSGLFVRLKYQTSNNKWNFVQYGANDIDSRYVRFYSGNVGIGTTSPSVKLAVADTAAQSGFSQTSLNLLRSNYGGQIGGYIDQGVGHGLTFSSVDNGSATERMRINSNGNVGIGTTSPSNLLHINHSNDAAIRLDRGGTKQLNFGTDSSQSFIASFESKPLAFATSTSSAYVERMRIDSSGVVRIGGTDTYNSSDKLTLVNNSGNCSLTIDSTSSGESSVFLADGTTGNEAYRGYLQYQHSIDALLIGVAGTERMRIDSSGNILLKDATAGTYADFQANVRGEASTNATNKLVFSNQFATSNLDTALKIYLFNSGGTRQGFGTGNSYDLTYHSSGNVANQAKHRFFCDGSEKLRIESSGNVGIGTSSPSSILHLDAGTGDTRLNIEGGTDGDGILALAGKGNGISKISFWDQLSIGKTSGGVGDIASEYLRINSSGNVGIGTSQPEEILHVAAASETVSSRDGVMLQSTSSLAADTGLPLVFTSNIGNIANYGVASIAGRKENATSGNAAGYLQFATGNGAGAISEAMRIDSSGKVQISSGIIALNASDTYTLNGKTQPFNGFNLAGVSSSPVAMNGYYGLVFGTNAAERMRIDSSGNVGIGTTSPSRKLSISSGGAEGVEIQPGEAGNTNLTLHFNRNSNAYITNEVRASTHTFLINADEKVRLDSSGRLQVALKGGNTTAGLISIGNNSNDGTVDFSQGLQFLDTNNNNTNSPWSHAGICAVGSTGYAGSLVFGTDPGGSQNMGGIVERMRIDSSGNVGIDVTNPLDKLHLNGAIRYTWGDHRLATIFDNHYRQGLNFNTSTRVLNIFSTSAANDTGGEITFSTRLAFGTGENDYGTERMRIDSSGKVGIGVTNPVHQLDIGSSGYAGLGFKSNRTTAADNIGGPVWRNNSDQEKAFIQCTVDGQLKFGAGGASERIRISSNGNVGIGTTDPSHPLEVRGSNTQINFSSSGTGGGYLMSTGSGQWSISGGARWNGAGWYARHTSSSIIRDDGDANIRFFTNTGNTVNNYVTPSERMRITSTGLIGINETNPGHYLDMNIGTTNIGIKMTSVDAGAYMQFADNSTTGNTFIGAIANDFKIDVNSGEALRVDSDRRLLIGATSNYAHANCDELQVGNTSDTATGITIGSSDQGQIAFADAGDNRAGLVHYQHTDNSMRFMTNGATNERMRIENDGEVVIKAAKRGITQDGDFTLANGANTTFDIGESGMFQIAVKTHTNHISGNDDHKGALFYACKASNQVIKLADPGSHFDENQTTLNTLAINVATGLNSSDITITNKTGYEVTLVVGKCILK